MSDAGRVATLNSCLTNYVVTPIRLLTTLAWCFYVSWQLSMPGSLIGFPLIIFPVLVLTDWIRRVSRQIQRNQEAFASVLIDFLAGIQTVSLRHGGLFSPEYAEQNDQMACSLRPRAPAYFKLSRPILHTVGIVCIAGITLYWLNGPPTSSSPTSLSSGRSSLFFSTNPSRSWPMRTC